MNGVDMPFTEYAVLFVKEYIQISQKMFKDIAKNLFFFTTKMNHDKTKYSESCSDDSLGSFDSVEISDFTEIS